MSLREFFFGPKDEESETVGIELDLGDYGDAPFEGVPTGKEVREQGAPSAFGNYCNYPGGYSQAVKDWRSGNSTYTDYCNDTSGRIDDDTDDDEPAPKEQKKHWYDRW